MYSSILLGRTSYMREHGSNIIETEFYYLSLVTLFASKETDILLGVHPGVH